MLTARSDTDLVRSVAGADAGRGGLAVRVALVVAFAWLTALSAQVCIPVGKVPITLQTLVVLLAGFLLKPRDAAAAMTLYVGAGLAGLPVFAVAKEGFTGGYLIGFVLAAPLIGVISGGCRGQLSRLILGAGVGMAVVYVCGLSWLAVVLGSVPAALAAGLVPFLPGAVLKTGVAISAIRAGQAVARRVERRSGLMDRDGA